MAWGIESGRVVEVTITDPDVHRKDVPVDDRGRVVIGREHAGKKVTIVVKVSENE